MLKSKLHRAKVTGTQMDYEGSIEVDEDLMETVGIIPYEQVHIYDINNGNRFITYVIPGKRGGKTISVNGAAARLVHINDRIIIVAYGNIEVSGRELKPNIAVLDSENNVLENKP
ncbi:MAG: aspartate 1-decarboxylase [Nitrospinota bacterium]|nr:aspartate 1-decarboxylase [Nitrospinota bacterium]